MNVIYHKISTKKLILCIYIQLKPVVPSAINSKNLIIGTIHILSLLVTG